MKNPLHWSKLYEKKSVKSDSFDDGDVEPLFEDLEDCEEQRNGKIWMPSTGKNSDEYVHS